MSDKEIMELFEGILEKKAPNIARDKKMHRLKVPIKLENGTKHVHVHDLVNEAEVYDNIDGGVTHIRKIITLLIRSYENATPAAREAIDLYIEKIVNNFTVDRYGIGTVISEIEFFEILTELVKANRISIEYVIEKHKKIKDDLGETKEVLIRGPITPRLTRIYEENKDLLLHLLRKTRPNKSISDQINSLTVRYHELETIITENSVSEENEKRKCELKEMIKSIRKLKLQAQSAKDELEENKERFVQTVSEVIKKVFDELRIEISQKEITAIINFRIFRKKHFEETTNQTQNSYHEPAFEITEHPDKLHDKYIKSKTEKTPTFSRFDFDQGVKRIAIEIVRNSHDVNINEIYENIKNRKGNESILNVQIINDRKRINEIEHTIRMILLAPGDTNKEGKIYYELQKAFSFVPPKMTGIGEMEIAESILYELYKMIISASKQTE